MNWPWEELGFPGPVGLPLIRRAYAERLKETRPEEKPEEFQRLHNAYQAACRIARRSGADDALTKGDAEKSDEREEAGQREAEEALQDSEAEEASQDSEAEEASQDSEAEEALQDSEAEEALQDSEAEEALQDSEAEEASQDSGTITKEWDFERLFAEEEAEERGKRFQRLRELRRKHRFRYNAWRPPPSDDPAEAALYWVAVSRALALVEELTLSGADALLWQAFCKSELFQYVRNHPDFVFGLEDFLRERPEIPEAGRRTLFHAYRLDAPPIRREYKALYQLLGGRVAAEDGTAFHEGADPWRKARRRSSTWNLLAVLLLVVSLSLMNGCVDFLVTEALRKEQALVWMEEDFGGEFVRFGKWNPGKTFSLLDTRTGIRFRARWDGPRDRERGRRGYVTDYTKARLTEELTAFAEQWDWPMFPRRNRENAPPDGQNVRLSLPLTGAGEGILTLGNLLSDVEREDWYQELPPECALYLCWGDWSFWEYDAAQGDFDGPSIRWYYERFFGPDLCRIALEETGVAASDMGPSYLLFPDGGAVTLGDRRFFHVAATGTPPGKALFHYFLSEDGAELFRVPAGVKFSGLTMEGLYQMDERDYEIKGFPEKLRVFREAAE